MKSLAHPEARTYSSNPERNIPSAENTGDLLRKNELTPFSVET